VQTKGQNGLRGQIERIRTEFGIEHQRLADLLDQ